LASLVERTPYRAPSEASPTLVWAIHHHQILGDNSFALNIPPFLGLHLVFNMALLRPYFPPLLDTLEIVEQLKPTELNHDCMQHESNDHIVNTQIKGTRQQRILLYRVVKVGVTPAPMQVAHTGPISTNISSSDGVTQRNGDHFFLRGRIDPNGIWWPPTYSN
jgi:hypothetical protein